MTTRLSPFQEAFVRSAFASQATIVSARFLQEMTPCPILVEVKSGGGVVPVVLRIARNRGGVEREALVFPPLRALGLSVPEVLAGPVSDPDEPGLFSMTLNSFLPGTDLLTLGESSPEGLELASDLLLEGISRMHGATEAMEGFGELPRRTLADDLRVVTVSGSAWLDHREVREILPRLQEAVEDLSTPLVFSSGDTQPGNFLALDGRLSGMVDFEKAAFVDPLLVLARFPVYDQRPFSRSGFVDRAVRHLGFAPSDFALRVAVFALRTLQTKVPVGEDSARQEWVLGLWTLGVQALGR